MEYNIGDIIVLGFKRRTFWQWVTNQPREPQKYVCKSGNKQPGSLTYIEPLK